MKKTILLLFSLVAIAVTLNAVPAKRGNITVNQPDGTTIEVQMHGDEFFNFATTTDGVLVSMNAQGVFEYANEDEEGNITLSGVKAHSLKDRTINDEVAIRSAARGLRPATIQKFREQSPIFRTKDEIREQGLLTKVNNKMASTLSPDVTVGKEGEKPIQKAAGKVNLNATRGLVILVNFSDKKFANTNTRADFDSLCNGRNYTYNGAIGSAWKYFYDQSNGAFDPVFDVVGPVTVSKSAGYYGGSSGTQYASTLMSEALAKADAAGVNFANYDTDNDGTVDFFFVFYAGYNSAEVGTSQGYVWPHSSSVSNITYDGKRLGLYACTSELNGSGQRAGIGTFSHEFSHVLGQADHYDTNYGTNYDNGVTPGSWDIMDQGSYNNSGKCPPNYSVFEKYYFGWAQPTVLYNAENVILPHDGQTYKAYNGSATCPAVTNTNWVWYFENRQKSGWDKYVPGHGLLVWHVKYSASTWTSNAPNNTAGSPYCTIVPADGKTSSYGDAKDPFPGTKGVTRYTPNTSNIADTCSSIAERGSDVTFFWKGGVKCTVTFNTQNRGTCATSTLTETTPGSGVTLPNVTPNSGYTFQGWARSASATIPDASAGDLFYPGKSCTLYAVYSSENDVLVKYNLVGAEYHTGTMEGYLTKGQNLSVTFKSAAGYQTINTLSTTATVKVGNSTVADSYTINDGMITVALSNVQENVTVDINVLEKYTIVNWVYGNDSIGWIDPEDGLFEYGDSFSFEIIPDDGYFISPAIKRCICITMGTDTLDCGIGFTFDYTNNVVTIPYITGDLKIVSIAQPLPENVDCSNISSGTQFTTQSTVNTFKNGLAADAPYLEGTVTIGGQEFFMYSARYNTTTQAPSAAWNTQRKCLAISNAYLTALIPTNAEMCCLKSISITGRASVNNNVAFYVNRYDTDYWSWDDSSFGSRGTLTKYWDSQAYYQSTGTGANTYTTSDYLFSSTADRTLSVECGTSYDSSTRLYNVRPYIIICSGAITGTQQNVTFYLKSLDITFDENACRTGIESQKENVGKLDVKLISKKRAIAVENIPEGSNVYVLSEDGKILRTKENAPSVQEFALPQGTYLIQIINDGDVHTMKAIAK